MTIKEKLVQDFYSDLWGVAAQIEGEGANPLFIDSTADKVIDLIAEKLPANADFFFDLKLENHPGKIYQFRVLVKEKEVEEIAIRTLSISKPVIELEKKEEPLPKILLLGGISFKLSYEMLEGIAGRRGEDHKMDLETLKKCLSKSRKISVFKAHQKNPCVEKDCRFDFYFHSKKLPGKPVLNIVVRHFPHEEIPFLIQTAYYMPTASIKGRFQLREDTFRLWLSQLPQE